MANGKNLTPDWDFANPIEVFQQWLNEAEATEPNDPNAMALATATPSGAPSVRMVLLKRIDQRGFCFFTNSESQKGEQLAANPFAALCFHWKSLRRQVRIEGYVTELPSPEVDAYFHSRSRRSQIGAAVSRQSRPLKSHEEFVEEVKRFGDRYPSEVPRPDYWRGYCVVPQRIEFWIDGPDRLHHRILFTARESGWERGRLYP